MFIPALGGSLAGSLLIVSATRLAADISHARRLPHALVCVQKISGIAAGVFGLLALVVAPQAFVSLAVIACAVFTVSNIVGSVRVMRSPG
jgi:hypothetical protein